MFEERHDGDVEFAHTATTCPVNAGFIINIHVIFSCITLGSGSAPRQYFRQHETESSVTCFLRFLYWNIMRRKTLRRKKPQKRSGLHGFA
jgi:hypothetical protein